MNNLDKSSIIGISALLVHAAKIDEIYSDHEKDLIERFTDELIEIFDSFIQSENARDWSTAIINVITILIIICSYLVL